MKIGDWDGGRGAQILLSSNSSAAESHRRALALKIVKKLQKAGIDCAVVPESVVKKSG
jgi:hypothetical protein